MSTIKSSAENLTLNADGSGNDVLIQSNGSTKAIVTGEGNVGVGVVPESWHASWATLQFGDAGVLSGRTDSNGIDFGSNFYYDSVSSRWEYITNDEATKYNQANGNHTFSTAASGSADAAITWTTALEIKDDGRGLSQFTAKVWVNIDSGSLADGHNVSSVSDNGTGEYAVSFANNLANDNYSVTLGQPYRNGSGYRVLVNTFNPNVNNISVATFERTSSWVAADLDRVTATIFGD